MARGKTYADYIQPRLEEIAEWCRQGVTNFEIAKRLGISEKLFWKRRQENPELVDLMREAHCQNNFKVENSLFERAMGYTYTEVTKELVGNELVVTKEVTKHQPGDTTAMIFWLKNRKPDYWHDVRDLKHSGVIKNSVDLSGLSTDELRKLAALGSDDNDEKDN